MCKPVWRGYMLAVLSLGTSIVLADGVAVYSGNIGKPEGKGMMRVSWAGNSKVRLDTDSRGTQYTVLTGGQVYMVNVSGARPEVYDMTAMQQQSGGMMPPTTGQAGPVDGAITKVHKTGRIEKIAGYSGEIYLATMHTDGRQRRLELVVSEHPEVVEATEAWLTFASRMAGENVQGITGPDSIGGFLHSKQVGLLRLGQEFRLKSLSAGKADMGLFKLPAQPTPMPSFGGVPGSR